jgi:hypothetical protein
MSSNSINVCEAIDCPFAKNLTTTKSFGCRKYSVAGHCHLLHSPYSNPHSWRVEDAHKKDIIHDTQYYLYADPNMNLDRIRQQNEEWLQTPEIQEVLELEKRFL